MLKDFSLTAFPYTLMVMWCGDGGGKCIKLQLTQQGTFRGDLPFACFCIVILNSLDGLLTQY